MESNASDIAGMPFKCEDRLNVALTRSAVTFAARIQIDLLAACHRKELLVRGDAETVDLRVVMGNLTAAETR